MLRPSAGQKWQWAGEDGEWYRGRAEPNWAATIEPGHRYSRIPSGYHPLGPPYLRTGHRGQHHGGFGGPQNQTHENSH